MVCCCLLSSFAGQSLRKAAAGWAVVDLLVSIVFLVLTNMFYPFAMSIKSSGNFFFCVNILFDMMLLVAINLRNTCLMVMFLVWLAFFVVFFLLGYQCVLPLFDVSWHGENSIHMTNKTGTVLKRHEREKTLSKEK